MAQKCRILQQIIGFAFVYSFRLLMPVVLVLLNYGTFFQGLMNDIHPIKGANSGYRGQPLK